MDAHKVELSAQEKKLTTSQTQHILVFWGEKRES